MVVNVMVVMVVRVVMLVKVTGSGSGSRRDIAGGGGVV